MLDQDFRPMKSKVVPLPAGVRAERCWCGHLAKVKESVDFSDKMGMKFFMCANYNYSPTRSATTSSGRPSVYSAIILIRHCVIFVFLLMVLFLWQSPPPICMWYHWIDTEQPAWAVQEIEERSRHAWASFHKVEREQKEAKK